MPPLPLEHSLIRVLEFSNSVEWGLPFSIMTYSVRLPSSSISYFFTYFFLFLFLGFFPVMCTSVFEEREEGDYLWSHIFLIHSFIREYDKKKYSYLLQKEK